MATGTGRLTWQNVAAPDFSGAVEAQRASALAFDNAMQRLGGAVKTFDNNRKDRADATVLRNAMQYQNADDLQAAIASGALMEGVNPDYVRVDALLKAQNQVGYHTALAKDRQQLAASEQLYEFNKLRNPQLLEEGRIATATAQQTLEHNAQNQPITWATNLAALEARQLTNADARNKYNRGEESYQANQFATAEYKKLQDSGLTHDPAAMEQYRTSLDPRDPGHAALLSMIDARFKDISAPVSAPGSYTGAVPTAPQSGVQVPPMNSPLAGTVYADSVRNNPLLPTFLKGLGILETGPDNKSTIGNNNFFNIKDITGEGPRRFDKVEGSNDSYRNFESPNAAYAEAATLLARKYPAALTARTPEEFAAALSNGAGGAKYATDPQHAQKLTSVINRELSKAGGTPPVPTSPAAVPAAAAQAPVPAAARPTAASMGIPQTTNAAAPAQVAPSAPRAPAIAGLLVSGNIDLTKRPVVKNADGSISTVRSTSVNFDGKEYLIPTVSDDGRIMSEEEAVQQFKASGKHLGVFSNPQDATAYAKELSANQARMYGAPAAPAPAAGQLTPENAAILARVTQQTLGLGQSAGNTAELSSFAAAAADKKTSFEEAGKSIIEAFPGLDRRDVDSMLTQVQAMHPMLRSPAAAAFVIKNTPKTSAWYDPFNWGNNIRLDKSAIETKVAELTKPEAVKTGVLANEVSANIGTKVAESEKKLTAATDSILALNEQLRNAAPGSARANALQSEVTRLEGKAEKYRSQIDSRSAQEKALTEELMRAANPELYAKQQKEAEKRKAAAAAADAAMAEAAKRAEQEAKARTEAEIKKKAATPTVDAIRNMTPAQLKELRESPEFFKLTGQRWSAFNARRVELESRR